ncbi:MAG: dephospho-CoA kinase [Methylococcales bacterium]
MLKIGMTGGIGSGKTTVGFLFQDYGIPLIDADQIAHQQARPGESAYQAIVDYFGAQSLNADNTLNRVWLKQRIFNSVTDKQALENITHPLIFDAISAWFKQQTARYCIASIPLLVETNSAELFDRVLVIDCSPATQIKRIVQRDNLSEKEAKRIILQQSDRENRLKLANDVIINQQQTTSTLVKDVEKLHNLYLSISQTSG